MCKFHKGYKYLMSAMFIIMVVQFFYLWLSAQTAIEAAKLAEGQNKRMDNNVSLMEAKFIAIQTKAIRNMAVNDHDLLESKEQFIDVTTGALDFIHNVNKAINNTK